MIKQLRYLCTLLLMVVASVAWAGEKTESVALSAGSYDTDHITWSSITGITVQQLKGSSSTAVNSNYISAPRLYKGHILSFTALDGYAIKSISITVNGTYYGNSMTAGTAIDGTNVEDNTIDVARTWTSTSGGSHVVSSVSDDGLSQIYIQNVASASNVQLRPTAISITYIAPDGALTSVSFTMPITTIGVGRTQSIINNGGEAYTGTFTYKSSDTSVATVTDGVVTGVGEGSATITATASAVEGLYAESSETFEVTVVNPTFALSQAVILTNFEGAGSSYGTTYKWADFSSADGINVPNWYGIDYMKSTATGHTNELQLKANSSTILSPTFTSATGYSVTVTFTGDLTLTFENGEAQTLTSGTSVSTNSNSVGFTLSTGGSTVYIASIAIAPTGSVLPPTISGNTPFLSSTTVTITSEYDVYYTLDGKDPTTASILYTEPFEVAETTTVKAIAVDGSNNSEIAEKVFEKVTVLTVAEAIDYIGTLGEETSDIVFVKGIVSQVDSYNSNYKSITYWISDDGETTTQMQVYSGKGLDSADFSSKDDLKVGDEVTVCGNVKLYNETPEFDKNNYLVAFNRPATPVVLPVPTFSPVAGAVEAGTTVTINIPEDENVDYVEYSFDQATWNEYTDETVITITEETTIYARSVGTDGSCSEVASATYTIKAVTVAVLPFEWAGGASANFLALDGVTAEGLGTSDYGETHNPYNIKLDTTGDYIQVNTDSQPGKVIVGVKMVGGATASTITVQESADGVNFTNVQALSISGKQNDILTLETTNAFGTDSRYVRLTFTKGSNVGVGPITITKPATEIVAEETLEIEASATSGEIAYSIAYPETGVALTAAADVDWISDVTVASDKVTFATTVNTGAERSGNITLTYGTLTKVVKVTQAAAPQMYTLTIGNPENVTITATYNVDQVINNGESAELENGTEVTFALTIPEGYALENVTVAGEEEGQTVELTENATTPGVYTFTMPAFNVTINATVAKIETTTYTLATSVTPGKRYIIVGVNENTYKAMGEQKSNNRAAVEISVNDKTATVPSTAGVYEFVIDGNATDGYTIYDEVTPGYLYAAGGTKNNYLKTEEVLDEAGNGTWTIEFDATTKSANIKSKNTGDNMRNWIRFNSGSSLFSCYASGQEDVYLYEKEVSGETMPGDVNKDGHVTIADVTALVNILLNKDTTAYDLNAADVDGVNGITIADVTALVNIILGKTN